MTNDQFHLQEAEKAMIASMPLGTQPALQEACCKLRKSMSVVTFKAHLADWWAIINEVQASSAAEPAIQWLAFQSRRFNHCFGPWLQVGVTDHALTEPSNSRLLGALQSKQCGLLFAVRDLVYLILDQEQHLKSLISHGSLRNGLLTRHQFNKRTKAYRRHCADEVLMELTLQHKGGMLEKMPINKLFLSNVHNFMSMITSRKMLKIC